MITYEDSRYLRSAVVRITGAGGRLLQPQWLDFSRRIEFTAYLDNRYVTTDSTFSWAHLGWKYLQDARAWWAIAEFSGVLDPFETFDDPEPGEAPLVLTVPSHVTFAFNVSPAGGRFSP